MNYAASYILNVQRIPEGYKTRAAAPSPPQPQPAPTDATSSHAPKRESWLGTGSNNWLGR
jgi:hypothetical protein